MDTKEAVARHGDVDIFRVTSLPKNLKMVKGSTIAFGEATGHHHTLFAEDLGTQITQYLDELSQKTYFKIEGGKALLKHQEHREIILNPGNYEVNIEQEHDYFLNEAKRVLD